MPLVVPAITAVMTANLASVGAVGPSSSQLAAGLAQGLSVYASSGLKILTVDTGTLGAGVGVGQGLIVPVPALLTSLTAAFLGAGIGGVMSVPTATAIANGMSQSLMTATILTVHVGTGVGTGNVKVIPDPGAATTAFITGFKAAGMKGPASEAMATAVAIALSSALLGATGFVVISGPSSQFPGGGAGTGRIL